MHHKASCCTVPAPVLSESNPLNLLKVKFQVSTRGPEGGIGRGIWFALRDIHASEGWRGLYRGLSPNIAGNASSWGLYFLLYVLLFGRRALRLSLFAETPSLLHEVITSSNAAPPSKLPTSPFLPPSTSSTLPKRVRVLLASLDGTLLTSLPLLRRLGVVTAILTNPIWVVKVRTFAAPPNSPAAHRGLWSTCPLLALFHPPLIRILQAGSV